MGYETIVGELGLGISGGQKWCKSQAAEALMAEGEALAFDCLVLDIHLPGVSGAECYGGLRARGIAPPAVFITAHDATETQDLLQRVAPVACLRKPFRGQHLYEAIQAALRPGG